MVYFLRPDLISDFVSVLLNWLVSLDNFGGRGVCDGGWGGDHCWGCGVGDLWIEEFITFVESVRSRGQTYWSSVVNDGWGSGIGDGWCNGLVDDGGGSVGHDGSGNDVGKLDGGSCKKLAR